VDRSAKPTKGQRTGFILKVRRDGHGLRKNTKKPRGGVGKERNTTGRKVLYQGGGRDGSGGAGRRKVMLKGNGDRKAHRRLRGQSEMLHKKTEQDLLGGQPGGMNPML